MKRNHLPIILGMALIALLMGSCDALFENQFGNAGLWQPTAAELAAQASDSNPAVAQPALSLQVEAELNTGGGTPLVENLVDVLLTQGSSLNGMTTSGDNSMNTIINALVPAETLSTPGALAAAIDAIQGTLDNLNALAANVDASGGSYAVEGVNSQNLAMTAALATVFDTLDPAASSSYSSVGVALEAYMTASATGTPDIADFVSLPIGTDFGTLFDSGTTVGILFGAAGVNLSSFDI